MSLLESGQPQNAQPTQQPAPTGASDGAPPPTQIGGGDDGALTTPQPGKEAMGGNGGPDWRALLAGEDADAVKDLARYQQPADFLKAFREQRTALSKRAEPLKLAENATPEQVAAYRKAVGVPEVPADATPDKIAEAYGIKPPEGYTISEVEKGMVGDFAKLMHGKHVPPALVQEATNFFFQQQQALQQSVRKDAIDKAKTWKNSLIDKHGTKEYEAQVAAANAFLDKEFGEDDDARNNVLLAQLPGGGMLKDHPWFVEFVAKQAMGAGFTDRIEANAFEAGGKSLADQIRDIQKLRTTNRAAYDEAMQPGGKMARLQAAAQSRGVTDEHGRIIGS